MKRSQYQRFEKLVDFLLRQDWPLLRKVVSNRVYDHAFYEEMRELKAVTFRNAAEVLDRCLKFESVFDIGCGAGQLLRELARLGKDAVGCEISEDGIRLAGQEITVFQADAAQKIVLSRRFDLVCCVEVAEHLDRRYAEQLVDNCASYGDQIFFTAAGEHQAGVGHINLQPRSFWMELFAQRGFSWERELSEKIQGEMRSARVVEWIVDNLMVFARRPARQ